MAGAQFRYDLRIPPGIVFFQIGLAVAFVAYVMSGALSAALDGDPLTGSVNFDLVIVIFGFFALLGMPWLLIKLWRQRVFEPTIELDPMGVAVTGHSFSGDTVRIAYGEVKRLMLKKTSGVRLLTITSSSGENIRVRDRLFPSEADFDAFLIELERCVDQAGTGREVPPNSLPTGRAI
ncbi:hypothetical protein [Qipengyuania sphaerica]|uniref:hypothetical protein n=1 Tax=Qipengyuania sphaerica TaxID=2867243 RepID=UPI001C8728C8|nr:hypothetical protein [Qipengyuania sphaerica]MBX7540509.1 hypothetical protein [Qipengyuania sphaerica]